MSSLADSARLVGFFSYSREDDKGSKGALSALREAIQSELSMQLGRSPANFQIWQDKEAIPVGTYWAEQIRRGISEAVFFIPIITPRVFRSKNCALEFEAFLARERQLGRADLVFPLLYIRVPELEVEEQWRADPVLNIVGTRQYFDWQDMRHRDPGSSEVGAKIEQFCRNVSNALSKPWVAPRQEQQDAAEIQRPALQTVAERPPEQARQPQDARTAGFVGTAKRDTERWKQTDTGLTDELADEQPAATPRDGPAPAVTARPWWPPSRATVVASGTLGAIIIIVALVFGVEIRQHDHRQAAAVSATPEIGAPPVSLRKAEQPAASGATGANPIEAAKLGEGPLVQPAAAAASVDKWAACRPNAQQGTDYIGGPDQPATLKLALTPAQQSVIAVRAVAVSPDGKAVVTAGDDAIIRVWQAANLKFVDEILGHRGPVYAAAFSSDGSLLATASFDGTVQIWDAQTYAHVQTFIAADDKGPVKQFGVAFEPAANPQYVASTGADGNVWIWDLRKRGLEKKARSSTGSGDPTVGSLSFLPNGRGEFVTANFDGTIRFFADGAVDLVNAFPGKALRLAYSRDGLVAVAGADAPGRSPGVAGVKVWNSQHAFVKAIPSHRGHAASVAWSHDGTRLASGGGFLDSSVGLWDVRSGGEVQHFAGHTKDVEAVAFHPNQKWLISGSEDGMMKIWDIATGGELLSIVGFPNREYVAYAPNNCYTGSANAASYVRFVVKDGKGGERDVTANSSNVFVPGDATDVLLPR